jgi:hypothetical protein
MIGLLRTSAAPIVERRHLTAKPAFRKGQLVRWSAASSTSTILYDQVALKEESQPIGTVPVAETLHLEFAVTAADRKQARSLLVQRQYGGGSKVLATLVLLLLLAGMLLGFYFRTQREVGPAYRPYVYAAVAAISFLIWLWIRRSRRSGSTSTRVEVSESGVSVLASGAGVKMPWSAFSSCLESPQVFVLVDQPKTTLLSIPEHAFPNEGAQEWFHTLATNQLSLADRPRAEAPAIASSMPEDSVRLRYKPRYRDYLDRTLASWRTWGFFAFIAFIFVATFLFVAANPPATPVYSPAQVFVLFILPFFLVMMGVVILAVSSLSWLTHFKSNVEQEYALSEGSIAFSGMDGSGTLPWTACTCYKETPWSFILWNSRTSAWIMLPKRAFASEDDLSRCRALLGHHLRQSRWFFS